MSKNHEEHSKKTPKPYQGKVIRPETAQAERQMCSVIEAANYFDLPPILVRFGDWVICENGIHCLYTNYHIPKERFHELDWIEHVSKKTWVHPEDFTNAFKTTKAMIAAGEI